MFSCRDTVHVSCPAQRDHTREAPTPTNISTKSEPEIGKNGTSASPAALWPIKFPGSRWPQNHTLGNLAPKGRYISLDLLEIHDLAVFALFRSRINKDNFLSLGLSNRACFSQSSWHSLLPPGLVGRNKNHQQEEMAPVNQDSGE